MKIVIDYQPVKPYTRFTVNGSTHSDIFGELGAVYQYPLQSWLYRRGPWPGLVKVLQDVARGGHMDITFIGRELDYQDFKQAIGGMENVTLQFECDYETKVEEAMVFDMAKTCLADYPNSDLKAQIEKLFLHSSFDEIISIESVEQFMEYEDRIKDSQTVITLSPAVFCKIKRQFLTLLRQNFKRPCESIVLLARTQEEKAILEEETIRSGISVMMETESGLRRFIEKYSVPEIFRKQNVLREDLCTKLEALQERYRFIREGNKEIRRRLNRLDRTVEELELLEKLEMDYDKNLEEIKWFEEHQQDIAGLVEKLHRERLWN